MRSWHRWLVKKPYEQDGMIAFFIALISAPICASTKHNNPSALWRSWEQYTWSAPETCAYELAAAVAVQNHAVYAVRPAGTFKRGNAQHLFHVIWQARPQIMWIRTTALFCTGKSDPGWRALPAGLFGLSLQSNQRRSFAIYCSEAGAGLSILLCGCCRNYFCNSKNCIRYSIILLRFFV